MAHVDKRWIRGPNDELAIKEGCGFNEQAAERPIRFVEQFCRQSKDPFAGQPLILSEWQKDFTRRLYGWQRHDGTRRYRKFYLEVAKKNGKSTKLSALKLHNLVADNESGAEVYIAAYTLKQARIIFDEAASMVRFSPSLSKILKVIPSTKHIVYPEKNGKLVALSSDSPSQDGMNASDVTFDELHRQANYNLWDVLKYAGASRRQPMLGSITTAGYDRESVCWHQHEYTRKVNEGSIEDTSHLGVIYGNEPGVDIDDPAVWRAANPNMGVTINEADFARELKEAKETPSTLNNFLRLRLNIWTSASSRFLSREKWDLGGREAVEEFLLRGQPCWSGLDLASTQDIAALVHVFGTWSNLKVLCRFWIPEEKALERSKRDGVPYLEWKRKGLIEFTPGAAIDYDFIRDRIVADAKTFVLKQLFCDPWNADHLLLTLQNQDGLPVQKFGQGFLDMNAPTKELERLVITGSLHHGNHPILSWMCENAVKAENAAGLIRLSKNLSTEKIDGMMALVMGIAAKMSGKQSAESVYKRRGLIVL